MKSNILTSGLMTAFLVSFACPPDISAQDEAFIFDNNRTEVIPGTEYPIDCNPIMPLWEHVPDGEPHIFEDPDMPGKYRVYLYGSHDILKTAYCGNDLVVWSAPVEDLSRWRYDGVAYSNYNFPEDDRIMYAPDVCCVECNGVKRYYLYPNEQRNPKADVAIAESPQGPFVNMGREKLLGFDPAVLVDDDGRVYAYWGFKKSYAAELDPKTMCTLKLGTKVVENMITNCVDDDAFAPDAESQSKRFRFFEASSIRKVGNMYVFVYARCPHKSENGGRHMLAYAYSTNPLGPWTYGGPVITSGSTDNTYPWGNIHGGISQINGQWYIFYHRQTNKNQYARQACAEPIEIEVKGNTVKIKEVPFTSQGINVNGLNPYKKYPAAIACHLTGNAYIKATYDTHVNCNPVADIKNGVVLGYKYYNFGDKPGNSYRLETYLFPKGTDGQIDVMLDGSSADKGGVKLGTINIPANNNGRMGKYGTGLTGLDKTTGKHAVYLVFKSASNQPICDMYYLQFLGK